MSERTSWQRVARRIRVPLGFVFAGAFLWLAQPTWKTMALSLLLVVPGVWLRGYAAGYVKKNAEITQTGPYAYTRNPLYLGSMMIAFGFAVASGSWVIFVALAAGFLAIYLPTIRSEEAYLREHFAGFDEYMRRVPRLLPRLTAAPAQDRARMRCAVGMAFLAQPRHAALEQRVVGRAMRRVAVHAIVHRRDSFRRNGICITASTMLLWVRRRSMQRWLHDCCCDTSRRGSGQKTRRLKKLLNRAERFQ